MSDTELLAVNHANLIGWLVNTVAQWVLVGAGVTLIAGGLAWTNGATGWLLASPLLGLFACAGGLWFSNPPRVYEAADLP